MNKYRNTDNASHPYHFLAVTVSTNAADAQVPLAFARTSQLQSQSPG